MNAILGRTKVGRLLVAAGLAAVASIVVVPAVEADEPERYNCPPGFVWIRMSGTACVQETVPANGKIGYDGHALCIDPFVGIYETRGTTDGKGVPGNPASSYAYLLECVTPEELAARRAAGTGGDLTQLLAGRPTELPDAEDLVVIGLAATGGILLAASLFRPPAKPPVPSAGLGGEPAEPEKGGPPEPPPTRALPTDPEEIRRRLEELRRLEEGDPGDPSKRGLIAVAEEIRTKSNAGQLTIEDYVSLVGIAADFASAIPIPFIQAGGGAVSIAMNLTQLYADAQGWDVDKLHREARERLADIALMRGVIASERDALKQALEEAEKPEKRAEPAPGRIDLDPSVMPDEMLRAERDRAQQRVVDAFDEDNEVSRKADQLRDALREERQRISELHQVLDAFDAEREGTGRGVASDGNAYVNLASGIDGFRQMLREGRADRVLEAGAPWIDEPGYLLDRVRFAEAERLKAGAARAGNVATIAGVGTAMQSGAELWRDLRAEEARQLIEQAIEGRLFLAGRLDQDLRFAEVRGQSAERTFGDEVARRDALRAEYDRRALERGHVLWTQ